MTALFEVRLNRVNCGESGVHGRQPIEHLRVTRERGGGRLEGPGNPREETTVEFNHT
jgi:hypothetical protein